MRLHGFVMVLFWDARSYVSVLIGMTQERGKWPKWSPWVGEGGESSVWVEGKHREGQPGFIQNSRREGQNAVQTRGLGRRGVESLRKLSFDHFCFLSDVGSKVKSWGRVGGKSYQGLRRSKTLFMGDLPDGPVVKNPLCSAGDTGSSLGQGTKIRGN